MKRFKLSIVMRKSVTAGFIVAITCNAHALETALSEWAVEGHRRRRRPRLPQRVAVIVAVIVAGIVAVRSNQEQSGATRSYREQPRAHLAEGSDDGAPGDRVSKHDDRREELLEGVAVRRRDVAVADGGERCGRVVDGRGVQVDRRLANPFGKPRGRGHVPVNEEAEAV